MKVGWPMLALDRLGHWSGLKPALPTSRRCHFNWQWYYRFRWLSTVVVFQPLAGMNTQSRLQAGAPNGGRCGAVSAVAEVRAW